MLITEIACQNLIGFPPAARVALKAGVNAFVSREADLLLLVRAVLFPGPDDADLLGVPSASSRKAALTLLGRDGHTWRLVRDFGGGRTLLRSDPTTRQAVKVADDPAAIGQYLHAAIGVPPEALFRAHLALAVADLPGRAPARAPRVEHTLPPNAQLAAEPQAATPDEARRRLPELRVELERAEKFELAQDELYALQNRLSELSRGTEGTQELERQIAEYDQKLDAFNQVKELSGGVEARLKKFPEAAARRDGALTELKRKREQYEQQQAVGPDTAALWRDPFFGGGLAAGVLCVLLALVLGESWSWLWIADLAGFGAAAFGAWRWVSAVEESDESRRRLADLAELEKRIHRQYELDTQPVAAAMRALRASTPEEVLQRLGERDMLEARRIALVRDLESRRADPQLLALEQERAGVERDLRQREAVVNAMGYTRDIGAIRREIQLCDEALAGAGGADSAEPLAVPLERAAEIAGVHPVQLLDQLRDRLGQYLAALTDRRFVGLRAVGPGQLHVVAHGGASGPLVGLPPPDRDLIYVALRLALAERVGAAARLPLFFDEPSVLVDAAHRGLFVKMLKSLGALTQVVVRAYDAPPAGAVDHVAVPAPAGAAGSQAA